MNQSYLQMLGVTTAGNSYIGAAPAGLAGEADVMMISGVGADPTGTPAPLPAPTLMGQLQQPITIGTITLPLYGWLLLAALLGGAGGYYYGRR